MSLLGYKYSYIYPTKNCCKRLHILNYNYNYMQLKRTKIMHNNYCCYMESLLIYCQEIAIVYLMAK